LARKAVQPHAEPALNHNIKPPPCSSHKTPAAKCPSLGSFPLAPSIERAAAESRREGITATPSDRILVRVSVP
jgi:hypothetical protein